MPTVADIAALLNLPVRGDASRAVTGMATLEEAGPGEISFISTDAFLKQFKASRAGAVIVQRKVKLPPAATRPCWSSTTLIWPSPGALVLLPANTHPPAGVDPAARVAGSAVLGQDVAAGPNAVIGERTRIGKGCKIHSRRGHWR